MGTARGWMRKGDSDRLDAQRTVRSDGPYDTACFHCQQAVEKYLKAVLALAGLTIPRAHDLEEIYNHCLSVAPGLSVDTMELATLTPYRFNCAMTQNSGPTKPRLSKLLKSPTAFAPPFFANCHRQPFLECPGF